MQIVGTEVDVPPELVRHTVAQGSWPWLFDEVLRMVERERLVPLDPVLLFWPRSDAMVPVIVDGDDAHEIPMGMLDENVYELRLVGRRAAESAAWGWPETSGFFDSAAAASSKPAERPPEPVASSALRVDAVKRRRSPFGN